MTCDELVVPGDWGKADGRSPVAVEMVGFCWCRIERRMMVPMSPHTSDLALVGGVASVLFRFFLTLILRLCVNGKQDCVGDLVLSRQSPAFRQGMLQGYHT